MDDETAEIELLQQNLNKTRQLSRKMTTILDSFDTRIAKLEKSILPLYTASQILNRRRTNIDRTLEKIDDVATNQEDLSAEESLILRGPQPGQLQLYKEAMERLNANIAFKGTESGEVVKIAELIVTGTKRLTQLYTKLVAESSSTPPSLPPPSPSSSNPNDAYSAYADTLVTSLTLPSSSLSLLAPLVGFLRTLPTPTTHPNHPASKEVGRVLGEAGRGYAEMRGGWVVRGVDGVGKGVVVRASENSGGGGGGEEREFGRWVEGLVAVLEEEYRLLGMLTPFPPSNAVYLASTYATLLTPPLRLFGSVLNSLVTLMRKNLQRYGFLALAAYESLLELQPLWERVVSYTVPGSIPSGGSFDAGRRAGGQGDKGGGGGQGLVAKNEFKEGLQTLRALCLRSFPEFLADIKLAALPKQGTLGAQDTSTKVVGFVEETVKYLTKIPTVQGAVSAALLALGDGNWRMGEGVQVGAVGKRQQLQGGGYGGEEGEEGDGEGREVLEHYIHDVISTTLTSLTTLSKTARRPPFGAIFLLNNTAYLRVYLSSLSPLSSLSSRSNSHSGVILSKPTSDLLQSNFRMAKAGYYDANFTPLMQAISDAAPGGSGGKGGGGVGKMSVKDKFVRFYDVFEEVVERHRVGRVLNEEGLEGERHVVEEEVVSLVVPSLRRFIAKATAKSKGAQKYVKKTPEEIESEIRTLFA